ncbi:hypothetical protein F6Y02_35825 [Bacillus megaterium]|nr:hypothetical protein [Priestia megaterium]
MKKYPYLYENYKKPEIARSVYEEEAKKQQQDGLAAVSFVADMVPVVSNVKGGWEASVGYDPITGNELSSFDRSVSGAGIVLAALRECQESGEIRKRRSRIRTSRKQSRKDRNQA